MITLKGWAILKKGTSDKLLAFYRPKGVPRYTSELAEACLAPKRRDAEKLAKQFLGGLTGHRVVRVDLFFTVDGGSCRMINAEA